MRISVGSRQPNTSSLENESCNRKCRNHPRECVHRLYDTSVIGRSLKAGFQIQRIIFYLSEKIFNLAESPLTLRAVPEIFHRCGWTAMTFPPPNFILQRQLILGPFTLDLSFTSIVEILSLTQQSKIIPYTHTK